MLKFRSQFPIHPSQGQIPDLEKLNPAMAPLALAIEDPGPVKRCKPWMFFFHPKNWQFPIHGFMMFHEHFRSTVTVVFFKCFTLSFWLLMTLDELTESFNRGLPHLSPNSSL